MPPTSGVPDRRRPGVAPHLVLALILAAATAAAACGSGGAGRSGGGDGVLGLGRNGPTSTASDPGGPALTGSSPSSTAPSTGPAGTAPATTPATTPATGQPTTTGPATTSPAPAARLRPAAPGLYTYDTAGALVVLLSTYPLPARTTLVVDAPVGGRQRTVRTLKDSAGAGLVSETVFEYRGDGVYLVSLRQTAGVGSLTQSEEIRPVVPALLLASDDAAGDGRDLDLPTTSGSAHLRVRVVSEERLTIGGHDVDTLVVHLLATLTGQLSGTIDQTVWVAPELGLFVRERSATDAGLGRVDYEATLRNLSPA